MGDASEIWAMVDAWFACYLPEGPLCQHGLYTAQTSHWTWLILIGLSDECCLYIHYSVTENLPRILNHVQPRSSHSADSHLYWTVSRQIFCCIRSKQRRGLDKLRTPLNILNWVHIRHCFDFSYRYTCFMKTELVKSQLSGLHNQDRGGLPNPRIKTAVYTVKTAVRGGNDDIDIYGCEWEI